jgi:hypothetical protein
MLWSCVSTVGKENAKARSDSVEKAGDDSTTVVRTAVFQARTQADAKFFADAYEGGGRASPSRGDAPSFAAVDRPGRPHDPR